MTTRRIPLRDLIASGPVLSRGCRARWLAGDRRSGAVYTGEPRVAWPVLPLQVFGIRYDLDLVLVDDHAGWDMHELARIATRDGPVWLCKDTIDGTLEQTIVADVDDLDTWLPEVPLRRRRGRVDVDDRSTARALDLSIRWDNFAGAPSEVTWRSPRLRGLVHRNGSTMGHSRAQVLAVLDLAARSLASHATITIDGRRRRLQRIGGLVPFAVALDQTQGGFSIGRFVQRHDTRGVVTEHGSGAVQRWDVEDDAHTVALVQRDRARTLRYVYRRDGDALELSSAQAWSADGTPALVAHFAPALPDVRRPFDGAWEGRFVLDVGGRPAHGTGRVVVRSTGDGATLDLLPTAPRWTVDRPLRSTVRLDDAVAVAVARIGGGVTVRSRSACPARRPGRVGGRSTRRRCACCGS